VDPFFVFKRDLRYSPILLLKESLGDILETRTKESNLNASLRVTTKPEGEMKVKGINPI